MTRIHCILWGCWCDMHSTCPKCGEHWYGGSVVQIGKLDWIKRYWHTLRGLSTRITGRCDVCGKRYWFWKHYYNCCSDECYSKWLPF